MPRMEVQDQTPDAGQCRAPKCRRGVLWARTAAGKAFILDRWEPVREGGKVYVENSATHWATCPDRPAFVKPRAAARRI